MSVNCELFVFHKGSGDRRRVRIQAEEDDSVGAMMEQLKGLLPVDQPWFIDGRPLEPAGTVGALGLVDGAILSAGVSIPSVRRVASGPLELRIVGGRGAGRALVLKGGALVIGRNQGDLLLADKEVSGRHAEVVVDSAGSASVADLGSTNGTLVEGIPITGPTPLRVGDRIQVGSTLLQLAAGDTEALQVVPAPGSLGVNRRFRPAPPAWPTEIAFPKQAEPGEVPPLNLVLTIAPGAAMILIAVVTKRPEFLLFAAVSPLIGIGRAVSQRRSWKKRSEKEAAAHFSETAAAKERLTTALRDERVGRRALDPDLSELAVHARTPGRRLWERQPDNDDFLSLRMGAGSLPSTITVSGSDDAAPPDVWSVPVIVNFRRAKNLSLVGPLDRIRPVAAAMVLQLAIRHAPTDVKIMVIADDGADRQWGWVAWLPHCRWAAEEPFALVGSDKSSTTSRLKELRALIKQRGARRTEGQRGHFLPSVIVVIDDASRLLPLGFAEILRDGPDVGIHALCLDAVHVPEGCQASLAVTGAWDAATFERQNERPIEGLVVDAPEPALCEIVACALAPLRALGEVVGRGELPASLRLLDLLGLPSLSPEAVAEHWRKSTPSSGAVVGLTADGPLELDLIRHGPHGLVAGTTRAGKTEMIKTLVAAFALANHPDDLSFLYIDFKGGRDYQIAKRLPHAVDLSTSEDIKDFERTLRLLEGELGRRRGLFTDAETSTIEGYSTARRSRRDLPPLGRLIVIVDEFAELVEKAPDQLQRLVSVARTGAAFGVHLLLATQRPSGVVTGQIDSNVALRVCFRVAKKDDGIEVIGSPDPADIAERHRGRGFMYAHHPPLTEFQAARIGGARPGSQVEKVELKVSVVLWPELGRVPPVEDRVEVPDPDTDFWDVFEAVDAAARLTGWKQSSVPWPKALSTSITVAELPATRDALLVPFVVVDDPVHQLRRSDGLRLGSGHVGIAGSGGTGRTTALRSLACQLAEKFTAADAHLYLLDFGGGGLRPLADLPHCGGTAFDDWDQAGRILRELDQLVTSRLELFSAAGFARLDDQRASGHEPLPFLVVLVDGWDVISEEGARFGVPDKLTQLLARGQSVGLSAAVAGDRSVVLSRMGRTIGARYLLRFNDANDYVSAGLTFKQIPASSPPGRVVIVGRDEEAHVARITAESGEGDAIATRALVKRVRDRDGGSKARWPRPIAPLPKMLSLAQVLERGRPPDAMAIPVVLGVSGESGEPLYLDLGTTAAFIGGPADSGRTSALRAVAELLLSRGVKVALVNPRRSSLSELASRPGVVAVVEGVAARQVDVAALSGVAQVVLIDDFEQLDPHHEPHLALVTGAAGLGVVAAGSSEALTNGNAGWIAAMKRSRTGLLFSPRTKFDGALFGGTLPEHMVFQGPRGRAVAGVAGRVDVVQAPMA